MQGSGHLSNSNTEVNVKTYIPWNAKIMSKSSLSGKMADILKWPAFLITLFIMWWSTVFGCALYQIKFLGFAGLRNDVIGWSKTLKIMMHYKALQVGKESLYQGKCMYLCNHRSWADFIVDQYTTQGRSMFMSRWAVFFVFPVFLTASKVMGGLLLFKRGTVKNKDEFNARVDEELAKSPQPALTVYPEGHRSTKGQSLPLKTGMLKYAFTRKMPVQIVIGANKESVLSERHCTARFGQTIAVGYSPVLRPDSFNEFEDFLKAVQQRWDKQWDEVFSADWEGLLELPDFEPDYQYPLTTRLQLLLIYIVSVALWVLTVWGTIKITDSVLGMFGLLKPVLMILGVMYVGASLWLYSRPVDALTLHTSLEEEKKHHPHLVQAKSATHVVNSNSNKIKNKNKNR